MARCCTLTDLARNLMSARLPEGRCREATAVGCCRILREIMVSELASSRPEDPELFSIGHSSQPLESFLRLLKDYDIEVVVDVRTAPYSRFNPQFNGRDLQRALKEHGLGYVFLGRELGGRPEGDKFYDPDGHVLYGRMAETTEFKAGLERLLDGATRFRVAMMCSEEDPAECHRFLLITRVLHSQGIRVAHIRKDGTLQRTEDVKTFGDWSVGNAEQASLFDGSVRSPWRSIRSVSRRSQPESSSSR